MSLRRRRPPQWLTLESSKAIGETTAIAITRTAGAPTAAWKVADGGAIYEYSGDALSHVVQVGPCKIEARIAPKWINYLDANSCNLTRIRNIRLCKLQTLRAFVNSLLMLDIAEVPKECEIIIMDGSRFTGDIQDLPPVLTRLSAPYTNIKGDVGRIPPGCENADLTACGSVFGTTISQCISITRLLIGDQSATQARVDAIILDIWQHRASFTYAGGITCNLDGNNAAPSGNVTEPEEGSDWHQDGDIWIPLTAGAMVYDLIADVNSEGFNLWSITVT